MKIKFRSVKFKSVFLIVLGAVLILIQLLSIIGWSLADQKPDYGSGIFYVGIFIGTWIFLVAGVLSLGFGIAAVKKCRLIKGTNIILTFSMGTAALAAMTLSSSVVLYSSGWQQYTLYATGLHYLFAILAMLTCGPISMVIVSMAYPFCFFTGRIYEFVNPDTHEYLYFYISTLVSLFVIPCVWAIVTNQFARGGGWKRLLAGLAVGYCDLIAIRSCFSMLGISLMPSLSGDAEWAVPIIAVLCAASITVVALWLFYRYDKKHSGLKAPSIAADPRSKEIHESPQLRESVPQILFCRKCGTRLHSDSSVCSNCGTAVVNMSEGGNSE